MPFSKKVCGSIHVGEITASWRATSSHIPYSIHTELRFLYIYILVSHGWQAFAVDYPRRAIAPGLRKRQLIPPFLRP